MISERFITSHGRRTRYLEAGTGRPLLLLHAFPLNADMWRGELELVPPGWRMIAPDFPGFGGTALGAAPATMDDLASATEGVLDALAIERAVVAGLSMGGYAAFALFRRGPQRFDGLVLADTRASADTAEGRQARRAMIDLVRAKGSAAIADAMLPKLLSSVTAQAQPELVAEVRRMIESAQPPSIAAALEAMIARPDSTVDLERVSCPVLVVVGADDVPTPVAESEAMHERLPGSRLVVFNAVGHLSPLEAPAQFGAALAEFLGSL